ncbi:MAG TPA: purine phosphorylase [Thermodesulfobacteriota bacterium]|nr:purine phosphorylase [Thermodesulfobacteriota bacterium]
MKRLGIIVAMTAEARSLTKQTVTQGQLIHLPEGPLVQLSGTGSKSARLAGGKLLQNDAEALVSWGSAGGLIPELPPGTLILPQKILAANGGVYSADREWHERLCKRLKAHIYFHRGPLVESPEVLTSSAEKTALFKRTGAVAVDMESAAVAAVAHDSGVPFVAIRAIVDPAGMIIPRSVLSAIDEFGQLRFFRFLKELLRRPMDLFTLIRLGHNFRVAHLSLASAACLAGSNLLVP